MWRQLLLVCVFAATHCELAKADVGAIETRRATGQDPAGLDKAHVRRSALVIGNGNYQADRLGNPTNDAQAMNDTLRQLGFDVARHENLTGQQMKQAILEFGQRLSAEGGVGLFYFAGHGYRVGDSTFMVPIDADTRSAYGILADGVDLRGVFDRMSQPRPDKLNVIVLDTCLTGRFAAADVDATDAPEQTVVAYATSPGFSAADGTRHGLYTAELLKSMAVPGRSIDDVFRSAAHAVSRETHRQQIPRVSTSLSRDFRLSTSTQAAPRLPDSVVALEGAGLTIHSRGVLPKDSAEEFEITFWESIKDSTHASDYEAYLKTYPNGRFATLAKARIERLRSSAPKSETPPETARPAPAPKPERVRPNPAPAVPPAQVRPAPATTAPTQASPSPAPASRPPTEKSTSAVSGVGELKDCPICPAMIELQRGSFVMGSNSDDPSEKPSHQVSISQPFAIGRYEVTSEQWNACVDAAGCPRISSMANASKNSPVRDVSWDDAQLYVKWLSKISGKPYRLPTEAEWEYANRAGTSTRFWWGDQMRAGYANCKGCGEPWHAEAPNDVGTFAANSYGVYDMNGGVWEWVGDCWHNSYKGAPADGRAWDEQDCRVRVIRGGSWRDGVGYMMSSTRFKYDASVRYSQNGFRVARDQK